MKSIILIALITACSYTQAQFGVNVYQEIPLTGAPFILDNTVSAEIIMYEPMNNERFIAFGSITYLSNNLRFDTVPTYGILDPGGHNTVMPGYTIQNSLKEFSVSVGVDYDLLEERIILPYIGANIILGFYESDYTEHVPTVHHNESKDASVVLGFRFKGGVAIEVYDNIDVLVSGQYGWKLLAGFKGYALTQFGFGARYWIFGK